MLKNIIIAATFLCACAFKASENPIQEQKAKKRARFPENPEDEREIREYIPNRANEHIIWEVIPGDQPKTEIKIKQPPSFFAPKARYNVHRIFRIEDKIIKSIESCDDKLLQSVLVCVSRDIICYSLDSPDRKRYPTKAEFESKLYVFAPEDYKLLLYGFFNDPEIPKKMRETEKKY